jgi:hypothetical protein
VARKDKGAPAQDDGLDRSERKEAERQKKRYADLEKAIDKEFSVLAKKHDYSREELEELRWAYRYDLAADYKLTAEDVEFYAAGAEAVAAGGAAPKRRRLKRAKEATPTGGAGEAGQTGGAEGTAEYARKSDVDIDLIEKYLDRKVYRTTRAEMAQVYKDMYGEDLLVPEHVDLVDLSRPMRDLEDADRARKLTKAQVFGLPEEAKEEDEKKAEEAATVEAAPAVKRESRALGLTMAWKRGVPRGPTYDAKWSVWNPLRFWVIPKRFAGQSVLFYYILFVVNLIIFFGQFVLLLIPFLLRLLVTVIRWVWKRFLKQAIAPRLKSLKDKAAIPPADGEKKPSGTKST